MNSHVGPAAPQAWAAKRWRMEDHPMVISHLITIHNFYIYIYIKYIVDDPYL